MTIIQNRDVDVAMWAGQPKMQVWEDEKEMHGISAFCKKYHWNAFCLCVRDSIALH
jgi:hypothetical protein